ncbi:hypothetical protein D9757_007847 [Collybiopsis confluens]|uniref:F-box domain-containing protein n=1 Tax=Collybiopsis confluens TaxID=2823264 RepID=A0A8H5HDC0_9AGAR|nr:hypothetical protein D9757_007847 [Collybiopsis confluens]
MTSRKHELDDKVQEEEAAQIQPRPRKRAKRNHGVAKNTHRIPQQHRKVKGKLGLLERLAKDMPLDIIFEVFGHLDPGDLLRLSRTSKDLRQILMSKSSELIWRIARDNVPELPARPEDLNEPQYARLIHTLYFDEEYMADQPVAYRGNINVLPSERYSMDILARSISIIGSHEIGAKMKAEFEALKTEDEQLVWMDRKAQEQMATRQHASLCRQWIQSRLDHRADELDAIRKQRKTDILDRLEQIGWREEAELMNQFTYNAEFSNHKLVKQSRKLTNYGWNNIKDKLVEFLSKHKTDRLAAERRSALLSRYTAFRSEYKSDVRRLFPTEGDIFENHLLQDLIWETPFNENIPSERFETKLQEILPGILNEWRPAATHELVAIMQKSVPGATISDLPLATSLQADDAAAASRRRTDSSISLPSRADDVQTMRKVIEACGLDPATATANELDSAEHLFECTSCGSAGGSMGRYFMRWRSMTKHGKCTFKVNDFGDETTEILACERLDKEYRSSICCGHCHKELEGSLVLGHLRVGHSDVLNADECKDIRAAKAHWYWNPRFAVDVPKPFRYPAPVSSTLSSLRSSLAGPMWAFMSSRGFDLDFSDEEDGYRFGGYHDYDGYDSDEDGMFGTKDKKLLFASLRPRIEGEYAVLMTYKWTDDKERDGNERDGNDMSRVKILPYLLIYGYLSNLCLIRILTMNVPFINNLSSASSAHAEHTHTHNFDGGTSHTHGLEDHGHTHEHLDHAGKFAERDLPDYSKRGFEERGFTIGIGGPVGSGKTALTLALSTVTNDIFTREDQEFLIKNKALPVNRILAIETGGCPHAAIREDISANMGALETLQAKFGCQLLLVESGGDNLAANYSRELADYIIYVIDVSGGDKIPRKGGPGISQSDLLIINKIDLAPYVGASLNVMDRDSKLMRGDGPTLFTSMKQGSGVDDVVSLILAAWRVAGSPGKATPVGAED